MYGKGVKQVNAKEFYKSFKEIDKGKYEAFYNDGIAFIFSFVNKNNECSYSSIGTGEQLSLVVMQALYSLLQKTKVAPAEFAESLKDSFLDFVKKQNPEPDTSVIITNGESIKNEQE